MKAAAQEVRKRKHISPEGKFQIFIEAVTAEKNGGVGEVIRRHGIHSSDLQRIKRTVEEGAIKHFKEKKNKKPQVSYDEYKAKEEEVKRLESVIVELAAEVTMLKKNTS